MLLRRDNAPTPGNILGTCRPMRIFRQSWRSAARAPVTNKGYCLAAAAAAVPSAASASSAAAAAAHVEVPH
jgi:hypothetical protein